MAHQPPQLWTLTARWILPVEGPPLEHGLVTVMGERILAVEPYGARRPQLDLGDAAVLPGLVNAHTHLDLRGCRGGPSPEQNFTDWLRTVVQQRRCLQPEEVQQNIRAGLKQSLAHGTTLLGDVSSQGASWELLASSSRCRAVVFYELLGLPRTRAHRAWAAACAWLRCHRRQETCRPGLSPHAPYSVRASLCRAAARLSQQHRLPLAIHLAETKEELELLEHHRGPFVPFLAELGVWDAQGLVQGIDALVQLSGAAANALFIHGNYLDPEKAFPRGCTIIYCPRTQAAFGHAPHPFPELLARGVRVALGTDSLASNPDLDMLAEVRCVHRLYPELPGATLLRMATLSGAEALGWQDETGSLVAGKSADLVVLHGPRAERLEPYELIFASSTRVQAVLFRGQWVSARGEDPLPRSSQGTESGEFEAPEP